MRTLFFDTETTGMWNFKAPLDDQSQPRPVQIAGLLFDNEQEVAGFNVLVNCEIESHPRALEVHKKTPELLSACGLVEGTALAIFSNFAKRANRLVAHNSDFDVKILQSAGLRNNRSDLIPPPVLCTMKTATNICRIPSLNGRPGFKWPTLAEAYSILVDEKGFADAHDALADTRACAKVFFALEKAGVQFSETRI